MFNLNSKPSPPVWCVSCPSTFDERERIRKNELLTYTERAAAIKAIKAKSHEQFLHAKSKGHQARYFKLTDRKGAEAYAKKFEADCGFAAEILEVSFL
jgi:hypothetical protein